MRPTQASGAAVTAERLRAVVHSLVQELSKWAVRPGDGLCARRLRSTRMPNAPIVTVMIPAYNAGRYIGAAIESCQRQTLGDIEILVIDDGSTDDTAAVVQRYTDDARVRLISLGANRGVAIARNTALFHATGTWIATLDADDWMTDDRLEVLVNAADTAHADLVHDDLPLIHEGEAEPYSTLTRSTRSEISTVTSVDLDRLIDCEVGGRSAYRLGLTQPILRRAFLESHGIRYDERLRVGEDYLLYLECLLAGAVWIQIPSGHYYYLQRPASASHSRQVPTLERKLGVCIEVLERPMLTAAQRASLLRYHRNLTSILAYQRVVEPAKERHLGAAASAAIRNPLFVLRLVTELPAVLQRRWAYHVRRDRHALDMLR
jgi:succinoglycan biosynthesis protein ExoO